jgi:transposase-like protein
MGRVPKKPAVVLTPGSKRPGNSKTDKYKSSSRKSGSSSDKSSSGKNRTGSSSTQSGNGKSGSSKSGSSKVKSSSSSSFRGKKRKKASSRKDNYRTKYSQADMDRAVRLVRDEGWCVAAAAKEAEVPRMTLSDRLKNYDDPTELPPVGRPQELTRAEEEAIVKCLVMCAEFQYPMSKRDLQNFVQAYVVENNVQTRWAEGKPGKDWVRSFTRRWRHKVKVKKPSNIKRSRAKISPQILREFFAHLTPNLDGVTAGHFFNYDESNLKDDPGADDCFFAGNSKYYEQVRNHSKTAISIMFCCSADGKMLPPMVVYKSGTGSVYQSWCEGGPAGTTYAASKNGWFDMSKFNQWFKEARVFLHFQINKGKKMVTFFGFTYVPVPYLTLQQKGENIFCTKIKKGP